MICKKCGANLRDDSMFCASCGQKVEQVQEQVFDGLPLEWLTPAEPELPQSEPGVHFSSNLRQQEQAVTSEVIFSQSMKQEEPKLPAFDRNPQDIWNQVSREPAPELDDEATIAWDEGTVWSGNPAYAAARRDSAPVAPSLNHPAPEVPKQMPPVWSEPAQSKRFCGSCGAPLKPGMKFCTVCGAAAPADSPAPAPVPAPAPGRPAKSDAGKKPTTAEKKTKKKGMSGGKIALIVVAVVALLVAIGAGAMLLLGDDGNPAEELAHEMLGLYLYEKDVDGLIDNSVTFEDEDLEDISRKDYEDTIDLLKTGKFRLQASEVEEENVIEDGSAFDGYVEMLEAFYGFEDEVEVFHEYEISVEYSCTETDKGKSDVTVTVAKIEGEWYLVSFDLSELLDDMDLDEIPANPTIPANYPMG